MGNATNLDRILQKLDQDKYNAQQDVQDQKKAEEQITTEAFNMGQKLAQEAIDPAAAQKAKAQERAVQPEAVPTPLATFGQDMEKARGRVQEDVGSLERFGSQKIKEADDAVRSGVEKFGNRIAEGVAPLGGFLGGRKPAGAKEDIDQLIARSDEIQKSKQTGFEDFSRDIQPALEATGLNAAGRFLKKTGTGALGVGAGALDFAGNVATPLSFKKGASDVPPGGISRNEIFTGLLTAIAPHLVGQAFGVSGEGREKITQKLDPIRNKFLQDIQGRPEREAALEVKRQNKEAAINQKFFENLIDMNALRQKSGEQPLTLKDKGDFRINLQKLELQKQESSAKISKDIKDQKIDTVDKFFIYRNKLDFTRDTRAVVSKMNAMEAILNKKTSNIRLNKFDKLDAKSGLTDMGIIFSWVSALDPGSVVREGEYATTTKATGAIQQLRNSFRRLWNGQVFTDESKAEMLSLMRSLTAARLQSQKELVDDQIAKHLAPRGISPEEVGLNEFVNAELIRNSPSEFELQHGQGALSNPFKNRGKRSNDKPKEKKSGGFGSAKAGLRDFYKKKKK